MVPVAAVPLQTPTPGLGPAELETVVPVLVRIGWFLGGLLVVVTIGWFVIEPAISRVIWRRNRGNWTVQEAISRYLRLVVVLVGLGVGAVLAGYGGWLGDSAIVIAAATLALGVAAQSVIGSLVSGLVLVLDPEFNVGDAIEWADDEGVVTSITLRVTRVRTPAGELMTVPNTVLTSQAVTKPYGTGPARIVDRFYLDSGADIDVAIEALEGATNEVDRIAAEPAPQAYVDELDREAIAVTIHYWIVDPRERDHESVRSAYARAAKRRLDVAGIGLGRRPER